jgi:predicted HTH transcriptional regulator
MGNLRDGGVILIGVAEGEKSWEIGGMSDEHLDTYDVDVVNDQVNAYVSPHANITLAILLAQSKKFLAIEVREFTNSPLVCKARGRRGLCPSAWTSLQYACHDSRTDARPIGTCRRETRQENN